MGRIRHGLKALPLLQQMSLFICEPVLKIKAVRHVQPKRDRSDRISTDEELIISLNITITPGEYVLFDGMMSNVPVGRMESGATRHMDFGICFVTEGLFDVRATVAIVTQRGSTTSRTGEGGLRVLVGKGV